MSVSVLVLTHNEEANLPGCLESLHWCDDVVVFDSHSSDRTVEIASAMGARVFQRVFDNYGSQREAARTSVSYRHPWLLVVDADERPDHELVQEVMGLDSRSIPGPVAFRIRRKDHFMGRWIPHATLYPTWFVRLFRPAQVRYESRVVHEYPVVQGEIGELRGHLIHDSFGKGMEEWWAKHVRYAELEALENIRNLDGLRIDWKGILSRSDPVRGRRALKELSFRMPCRPTLRFLYMYLLRRGFLDGLPGFTYCRLLSLYERMIVLKMKEILRREKGLPV